MNLSNTNNKRKHSLDVPRGYSLSGINVLWAGILCENGKGQFHSILQARPRANVKVQRGAHGAPKRKTGDMDQAVGFRAADFSQKTAKGTHIRSRRNASD